MQRESPEDFQEVASILRESWVQTPDGSSASRYMRPRYVAKKVANATHERANHQEKPRSASSLALDIEGQELQKTQNNTSKDGSNSATYSTTSNRKPVSVTATYVSIYSKEKHSLASDAGKTDALPLFLDVSQNREPATQSRTQFYQS